VAACLPAFGANDGQWVYDECTHLVESVDGSCDRGPTALVHPGLLIERTDGITSVLGPLGVARVDQRGDCPTAVAVWQAIAAVGALITGDPNKLIEVSRLLREEDGSRTLSYFLAISRDAGTALSAIRRLRDNPVTVLGCGGIGGLVAVLLAGAGVQTLTLIDGDRVEMSNLNRQLFFTRADVGRFKVKVLNTSLVDRYPSVVVKAMAVSCRDEESIRHVLGEGLGPVVVSADDPVGIGTLVTKVMQHTQRVVYTAGYRFSEGSVSSSVAQQAAVPLTSWESLPCAVTPSFGPQNAQIASALATRMVLDMGGLREADDSAVVWDTATHLVA
jgi:hypothetical protein